MPLSSDSEDDPDYVPPPDANYGSGDERFAKRARKCSPPHLNAIPQTARGGTTETRQALWVDFQASVSAPTSTSATPAPRMVKIEKRFRFAGEDVVEIEEVPEGSEAAKKWPLWKSPEALQEETPLKDASPPPPQLADTPSTSEPAPASSASVSAAPTASSSKPPAKRPGPRKPKTTLAPLPGAQKAKKLTTLDKSAMDWRAHVRTAGDSGLKDELEANRRGGGYLEKIEFLQRVEERKADALDASTSKRRRT
ncbi:hypothetical protein OBBRIDRAFT_817527 [Obba rivulosa]|uniref:SWR1-complex protein 5 n=1 Tax=Obba rivulosa TaxID=1052685 RepID=A0A8E2DQR8_9APHY|nr:hypothetical protein OBBRIDRAFT_817527 [Obba rivulosa]